MSREIKFRAWNGQVMEYGGFNIHASEGKVVPYTCLSRVKEGCPLMQFTGLTDKNGKEIFEGDILSISFGIPPTTANLEIVWNDYGWYMKGKHSSDYLKDSYRDDLTTVGNIHEHSHLLD